MFPQDLALGIPWDTLDSCAALSFWYPEICSMTSVLPLSWVRITSFATQQIVMFMICSLRIPINGPMFAQGCFYRTSHYKEQKRNHLHPRKWCIHPRKSKKCICIIILKRHVFFLKENGSRFITGVGYRPLTGYTTHGWTCAEGLQLGLSSRGAEGMQWWSAAFQRSRNLSY